MQVVDDERRNPIEFGFWGQRSRSTLLLWIKSSEHDTHCSAITFYTSHVSFGWEDEPYWFWVVVSKVKFNSGTLCIKHCGHDTDYSFCPITFKLHMQVVDYKTRNPVDFGLRYQRSRSTLTLCLWYLVSMIKTTVIARSLSNFICMLFVLSGGTLMILSHKVKGQVQL